MPLWHAVGGHFYGFWANHGIAVLGRVIRESLCNDVRIIELTNRPEYAKRKRSPRIQFLPDLIRLFLCGRTGPGIEDTGESRGCSSGKPAYQSFLVGGFITGNEGLLNMSAGFFSCCPQGSICQWISLKKADTGFRVREGLVHATFFERPRGEPGGMSINRLENDDPIPKNSIEDLCLRACFGK